MKQISIFLQNTNGQLAVLVELFSEHNINLRAMSLADTQDYGILRCIAENTEKAEQLLKDEGYAYSTTEVAAIPLPDRAGALAEVVRVCAENQIGIEYAYAFLSAKPETACLILRTDNHAQAVLTLARNGIKTATMEELFMM